MIDAIMLKIGHIKGVVTTPTVRINDAVRDDFLLNNGHKSSSLSIRNNVRVDLATSFNSPNTGTLPAACSVC